jgi:hypothetical protein
MFFEVRHLVLRKTASRSKCNSHGSNPKASQGVRSESVEKVPTQLLSPRLVLGQGGSDSSQLS